MRPARIVGIALKTNQLDEAAAARAADQVTEETGLPASDPVRWGAGGTARRGAGRERTVTFRHPWPTPDSTRWPRCCAVLARGRARQSRAGRRPGARGRPTGGAHPAADPDGRARHGAAAAGQRRPAAAGGRLGRAAGVRLDDRALRDRRPRPDADHLGRVEHAGDERGPRRPPDGPRGGRCGRWSTAFWSARVPARSAGAASRCRPPRRPSRRGWRSPTTSSSCTTPRTSTTPTRWRTGVRCRPARPRSASGSRRCGSCGSSPRTPT